MTILTITKKEACNDQPCIKVLDYGTFVTDVPSGKDCVYVKVKKKGRKEGYCREGKNKPLSLEWQSGFCVLFNLTYGTLRQIPGDTPVTPLVPCLTIKPLTRKHYNSVRKECYHE